jgi:hypothetical protein
MEASPEQLTQPAPSLPAHRRFLPFALLCSVPLAAATLWTIFFQPLPFHDFLGYWSAARLFLGHQNPYSSTALLTIEHSQGWPYPRPLIMLCPPWALPVISLFGFFSFPTARLLWLVLSLLLNLFSAMGLWRFYGGAARSVWIPLAVFLTFTPLGTVENMGQITPLILACITAFLLLVQSKRWLLAGTALLGFGLKPHLLWLLSAAVLLWAVRERKWRLLLGAFLAYAVASFAAVAFNLQVIHYVADAYGAAVETSCGFGGALRLLFGVDRSWLQYLPSLVGASWFVWFWTRRRAAWSWPEHLPLLLLVSVASSPYCWFHDFILVLPAFIALAARQTYRSVPVLASWLVVQLIILLPLAKAGAAALSALWIPFWLLARSEAQSLPASGHSDPLAAIDRSGISA